MGQLRGEKCQGFHSFMHTLNQDLANYRSSIARKLRDLVRVQTFYTSSPYQIFPIRIHLVYLIRILDRASGLYRGTCFALTWSSVTTHTCAG